LAAHSRRVLLIPNYVGPSAIEGVGVFAAAPVRKGTAVWSLDERFDHALTAADIAALGEEQRAFVERYGYTHTTRPELTVLEMDNGRFMNHSDSPNTDFTDPVVGWAIRDIAEGEEITCDYAEFEPGFAILPGRFFVERAADAGSQPKISPE
jgi:SET domain-containing protein